MCESINCAVKVQYPIWNVVVVLFYFEVTLPNYLAKRRPVRVNPPGVSLSEKFTETPASFQEKRSIAVGVTAQ